MQTIPDRLIDALMRRALRSSAPSYLAALRGEAAGERDHAAWQAWERTIRRAHAFAILIGLIVSRSGRESDRGAIDVPAERMAMFSEATFRPSFDLPFGEALDAFRREIPDLARVLPAVMGSATAAAEAIASRERAEAWPKLRARIVRVLALRDRKGALEAAKRGEVYRRQAFDRGAIADAIGSTLGQAAVVDRLGTEYRTSLLGAFNAGSYVRLAASRETFPVFRLSEVHDRRTRGNPDGLYPNSGPHWQMDGFCAPADDPVWKTIWPPNGYNCRATVDGMTWSDVEKRGWTDAAGGLDRAALQREFAEQWRILVRGEYPDSGFASNKAVVLGLA